MTGSVSFDRAADIYDETRGFPPGIAAHVGALLRDAGHLTPESRVLDVWGPAPGGSRCRWARMWAWSPGSIWRGPCCNA